MSVESSKGWLGALFSVVHDIRVAQRTVGMLAHFAGDVLARVICVCVEPVRIPFRLAFSVGFLFCLIHLLLVSASAKDAKHDFELTV